MAVTEPIDLAFVAQVRTALAGQVRAIVDEAEQGAWRDLPHRQLAERIKALVAATRGATGPLGSGAGVDLPDPDPDPDVDPPDPDVDPPGQGADLPDQRVGLLDQGADLLDHALRLADQLRELQGPSGLFTGGDNVDSPPDSAFSVNDLADALLLLRHPDRPLGQLAGGWRAPGLAPERNRGAGAQAPDLALGRARDGNQPLTDLLEHLLAAATPALTSGGVHTPNHRWELCAALARLHRLSPAPEMVARVDQWLAEGIDIDGDGLYSERSANYAAHVSNPSLLTLAEVFDRPDLVDAVERNLDATLDLLLPDGSVETVMSRRQDQHHPMPLAAYLLALRRVALLRGRGDLAWAAELALAQGIPSPAEAATRVVLDPDIARRLPAPARPESPRQRVFRSAGLLVDHRPDTTTVFFGGSDYPRHRRIRSGLANSPTFLRRFAGAAVLESARLSRTFFGLGPFRSDGLAVERDSPQTTTVRLAETVSAAYYQPLAPPDRHPHGDYRIVDEGRFSAAMDFGRRAGDEVTLTTTIQARLTAAGVELTLDLTGAVADWALELAFRPGGRMTGARALGQLGGGRRAGDALETERWQLAAGTATYQVGEDAITVTLVEASDGRGDVLPAAHSVPAYEPGEEYRYLGGTDAVSGQLLYVAGRVPAHVRLLIARGGTGTLR